MKIFKKAKEIISRIFGSNRLQLPTGDPNIPYSPLKQTTHQKFSQNLQNMAQLSPEELNERNRNLAKTAAYNCLADMVVNSKFDDKRFFNESIKKSQFRLQLEELYQTYGHGTEVPESMIPETHIKVAREIQRSLSERKHFVEGYGLMQDNTLSQFLQTNNLDLKTILIQNQGDIFEKISNRFMSAGFSYVDFNTMSSRDTAIDSMHTSIIQALEAYVQAQQPDRI